MFERIERMLGTRKIILFPMIFIALVILIAGGRYAFTPECYDIRERVPQEGSQGYQTWYGDDLKSFYHRNHTMCVPEGWYAIGARETGDGWARFEEGKTGIMVRRDAFSETRLTFDSSRYAVTLLYPTDTPGDLLEMYTHLIENAFERTGSLFNDTKEQETEHTVLVTAGLEGVFPEETYIYPDPHARVTVLVRDPRDPRAEELFIHAVMHLYNRFDTDRIAYQDAQSPVPPGDFQELEATWAETAFRTSRSGREKNRLAYLYSVHTAVRTGNFGLIIGPPFNDQKEFQNIAPSVVVPHGASEMSIQYGHYILGPLSMVAIDGLLYTKGATTSVEDILKRIHSGEAENFFAELARYFTDEELNDVWRWMDGEETIPQTLIQAASNRY